MRSGRGECLSRPVGIAHESSTTRPGTHSSKWTATTSLVTFPPPGIPRGSPDSMSSGPSKTNERPTTGGHRTGRGISQQPPVRLHESAVGTLPAATHQRPSGCR